MDCCKFLESRSNLSCIRSDGRKFKLPEKYMKELSK